METEKINTSCPTCKKANTWSAGNDSRPFCSYRCKLIDLGEWAEGRAIPGDPTPIHQESGESEQDS